MDGLCPLSRQLQVRPLRVHYLRAACHLMDSYPMDNGITLLFGVYIGERLPLLDGIWVVLIINKILDKVRESANDIAYQSHDIIANRQVVI